MNFCILIELSKKKISFLYNRSDGESKFASFTDEEQALPLAIYCLGNDIQLGQFAIDEAMNHNPNAYTDVFQIMKTVGTYKYKGEEWHYNTLLKNAIEKYLAYFFDSVLVGQHGRLEQHIAKMPLCFVFNSDIEENERFFVRDCFRNGGYGNVGTIDYDQIVIEASTFNTSHAVCVTSDGQDLFISLYETKNHKYLGSTVMRGRGKDPRVKTAVSKLWESLGYENYYLDFEKEKPILSKIAEDFISSGQIEFQNTILFSDGRERECFLSMLELDTCKYKDDGKIETDLRSLLVRHGISPLKCTIVLKGKAANNGYFRRIFIDEFNTVTDVNESFRKNVLSQLLCDIKSENYIFNSDGLTTQNNVTEITQDLKKHVRTVIAEIKGKIRKKDMQGAFSCIDGLVSELQAKNIHNWDEELSSLKEMIMDIGQVKSGNDDDGDNADAPILPEPPREDPKKYQRDVRIALAEVKAKLRKGTMQSAETALKNLEINLSKLGIHAYDNDINKIKSEISNVKSSDVSLVSSGKAQKLSKAESLLREGRFVEAKRAFASDGNSEMARVCADLIRSNKRIVLYQGGLSSHKRNKDIAAISSALHELNGCVQLFNKYRIDTTQIENLIKSYKSIL